jgi:hypothetical protein
MPRKTKNRFVQPVSFFKNTERKDLGQAVDDQNVLKNVTEVKTTKKGGKLPTYKEAWDMDLEGIKGMYGSYEDYVSDMQGIQPGDKRDQEREAARAEAEKDKVDTSHELDDIEKPGSDASRSNAFTAAQGRGQSRLIKSRSRDAIRMARKQMRSGAITREEFEEQKKQIRTAAAEASRAQFQNAVDQLTQGRNPYTSSESVVYGKEMTPGEEGSDKTVKTDEEIESEGLVTVDSLINKDKNPDASIDGDQETRVAGSGSEENPDAPVSMRMSAIGQYGFKNLKFGRRK